MDQWKSDDCSQAVTASAADLCCSSSSLNLPPDLSNPIQISNSEIPRQRPEVELKNPIAARKVQKADREKLRRDRLNEHFIELGNTLDPDRPKNDKATILNDTVQALKDLTAEVNRLKSEYATLSEESRELTQEKNELREEKASLKSDIDNLNVQYQQRVGSMFPWTGIDPSVLMASPYSFPVPVPVRPGPIPMHPSLQPFPFFGNQNAPAISNPCSTFIPYPTPPNPPIEQTSAHYASVSQISIRQDSRSKTLECQKGSSTEKCDGSNDVATELELKTPGSAIKQDTSPGQRKGKQSQRKERSITDGSCSSRYSSSQGYQDSSSNSTSDVPKLDN